MVEAEQLLLAKLVRWKGDYFVYVTGTEFQMAMQGEVLDLGDQESLFTTS